MMGWTPPRISVSKHQPASRGAGVAIDFADLTVHLCEITYAKTLQSIGTRLQSWSNHWPAVVEAIHRDSSLSDNWHVIPRVFVPQALEPLLRFKISTLKRPTNV